MKIFCFLWLMIICFSSHLTVQAKVENIVLITLDGARLQEVFGGLDAELYRKIYKDAEKREVYQTFWAETAKARREKVMPFLWQILMKNHGSIAGNRQLNSEVKTTNNYLFSYPGYSEIVTGEAHDEIIKSNSPIQNKFPSFLDFVQKKLKLNENQVASFASWEIMNYIVTTNQKAFTINAGFEQYASKTFEIQRLNAAQFETPTPWESVRHDYYTFRFALDHLKRFRPRVLHIGFGETDDWAHNKNYDQMLKALKRTDNYLRQLFEFWQNDPHYKGKTSIIITIDHGRGSTEKDWHSHGDEVPEARYIWMAFVSPDSKMRGEFKNTRTIYQNQVAATLCRFLGLNYAEQNPNAGKPINLIYD